MTSLGRKSGNKPEELAAGFFFFSNSNNRVLIRQKNPLRHDRRSGMGSSHIWIGVERNHTIISIIEKNGKKSITYSDLFNFLNDSFNRLF